MTSILFQSTRVAWTKVKISSGGVKRVALRLSDLELQSGIFQILEVVSRVAARTFLSTCAGSKDDSG